MTTQGSCSSLLLRIRNQHRRQARYASFVSIQKICCDFWLPFCALLVYQCPTHVYNSWRDPFPMNLEQFHSYIETPIHKLTDYTALYFLHSLLSPREYVQIELGENAIDESMTNRLEVHHNNHPDGALLYIFNRIVEPTINRQSIYVFVKFAANDQPYWQIRYPYHFQSFTVSTLRCILKQLTNSSTEYMRWPDKSACVNSIEHMYNKNPEMFNKKVIKKCGIILGYRYRPAEEYIFSKLSPEYHYFSETVRALNASHHYTCYVAYIIIAAIICYLFKIMPQICPLIRQLIYPSLPKMDLSIQQQMKQSNIVSLQNLDALLLETSYKNNYYNRLFIVHDKYLVMLLLDLEEKDKKLLRHFSEYSPLIIVPINSIRNVRSDGIGLNIYYRRYISFPVYSDNNYFQPANWLHNKLMILSEQYRYNWQEQEELRDQQTFQDAREEENKHFLDVLIHEEIQYQLYQNRNNISRIWNNAVAASPRFIAQFRVADRPIVTHSLVGTTCSICLEDIQLNQYLARWPCAAQHIFHFNCMLNVLRTGNTCPLCRHPVETADVPSRLDVFRLIFR